MGSPAQDVATFISDQGLGTLGTDLGAYEWMPDVDFQAVVLDQDGFESEVPSSYVTPGIQVLVRGKKGQSPIAAYDYAQSIYNLLIDYGTFTANGTTYPGGCYQSGTIGSIGRDSEGRPVFSANFYLYTK